MKNKISIHEAESIAFKRVIWTLPGAFIITWINSQNWYLHVESLNNLGASIPARDAANLLRELKAEILSIEIYELTETIECRGARNGCSCGAPDCNPDRFYSPTESELTDDASYGGPEL